MVRKIKVVDVYSQEDEQEQEPETERVEEETPLELKNEVIAEEEEEEEEQEPEPPKSRKKKQVIETPTTEKTVQQVQCSSCGKSMTAKSLRYSHAKYCTERSQEPEPAPKIEVKKAPVKRSKTKPREAPTYDADEVPPPPPPPASRLREKHETPEQFWRNTVNNLREKKLSQYKSLLSNAF
jgi:hypothetical protein